MWYEYRADELSAHLFCPREFLNCIEWSMHGTEASFQNKKQYLSLIFHK
jgi:hypothetical protein